MPPNHRRRSAVPLLLALLGLTLAPGSPAARAAEPATTAAPDPAAGLPDYATWRKACRRLPTNRALGDRTAPRELLPLRTFAEFDRALGPFLEQSRTGALARAEAWLGGAPNLATFLDPDQAYFVQPNVPYRPFAQRHEIPAGTRVFLHGDLHGDIHSLLAYLDALQKEGVMDGFQVTRENTRLVFLGDYTDRGFHGVEVLYTLLRLRLANPDRVLLVRGNHEDVSLTARYGFLAEANAKYGREFDGRRVTRLYDYLPAVLYLACGTNVVQCNHGGLEPGYDPRLLLGAPPATSFQFLGRLEQRRLLTANPPWVAGLPAAQRRQLEGYLADFVPESPTAPTVLGFMWNDFTVFRDEPQFTFDPARAFVYGDEAARQMLADASTRRHRLRAVFRAHQHSSAPNPLMRRLIAGKGVFRHWQEKDSSALAGQPGTELAAIVETSPERPIPEASVWTFNVVPDSVYGIGCGFSFDTAGELRTAERWEDWRLRVINLLPLTDR